MSFSDEISAKISAWLRDQVKASEWDYYSRSDSPIEGALIHAVTWVMRANTEFDVLCSWQKGVLDEKMIRQNPNNLFIWRQFRVIDWPIDYLIGVTRGAAIAWLAIECDGHDFHERTKEQAIRDRSRDRTLQERGYTVFRFTGAEIYRDPLQCAEQVSKWVYAALYKLDQAEG